jgi:protein-S-isoprenylcysteine O-methyltransferase Ste14
MNPGAFLQRRRVALSWVFVLLYLALARPLPTLILSGIPLMILGAAVRTWASGHIRKQERLATGGPYGHTRNPLYLGSALMAAGALVMAGSRTLALLFIVSAVPLYVMVMKREEAFLGRKFGPEFAAYRKAVPLFIPRLTPYQGGGEPFRWNLVRRHREWRSWAGGGAVTLLLATRYYLVH